MTIFTPCRRAQSLRAVLPLKSPRSAQASAGLWRAGVAGCFFILAVLHGLYFCPALPLNATQQF
jgi:hypothetical protein